MVLGAKVSLVGNRVFEAKVPFQGAPKDFLDRATGFPSGRELSRTSTEVILTNRARTARGAIRARISMNVPSSSSSATIHVEPAVRFALGATIEECKHFAEELVEYLVSDKP